MIAALDIMKVPLVNSAILAATTFIEGITDVLQVLILLATLMWTIVKIANAVTRAVDDAQKTFSAIIENPSEQNDAA